jgi:hypothetical protein
MLRIERVAPVTEVLSTPDDVIETHFRRWQCVENTARALLITAVTAEEMLTLSRRNATPVSFARRPFLPFTNFTHRRSWLERRVVFRATLKKGRPKGAAVWKSQPIETRTVPMTVIIETLRQWYGAAVWFSPQMKTRSH